MMKPGSQSTPKTSEKSRGGTGSVSLFAVQCGKCFKWRVIPTKEEYEDIRSRFVEDPWFCSNRSGISCEDLAEIEYDNTRTWVIDKPNIPKTPDGFEREVVMRKDYSRMDTYYITPTGKKVRAPSEVEKYLEANPKYKGVAVSDFNFAVPKVMEETIPKGVEGRGSTSSNKKLKMSKVGDD
ncbi:PREDICTED: methyl-CpG-binding domain-containing protein 1-like [Nelumbo nucifera]|uniref:Methyl-CpG-binding domain-containing protein 4-like n=2 Tax=Nelumbo nucifera TaxID=4432 RepID=A0A822Z323_NELNU|nr:PREDICTED: methyl-CpG-binding domain-containing protein 1-like [Nelumbo nucifera]DAD37845.1 TPA_asm: hypothetical protein HUJ06_008486 [Nelumbo nucifera]